MSLWWIGVNPETKKMRAFEATLAEAFSPEFENRFGLAFGSYRTQVQAEADIKTHTKYLLTEAKIVRSRREKTVVIVDNTLKTKTDVQKHAENLRKLVQNVHKPTKTSKSAESRVVPVVSNVIRIYLASLIELKVAVIRAIEAAKCLKEVLEENDKNKR